MTTEKEKESVLTRKIPVSSALSELLGGDKEMARTEVTKKIWEYIKANNLQDPSDKRIIVPDAKLATVLGSEPVHMMKMSGLVNKHFIKA